MFRKFFSFFFSKAEVPKETYGKEGKNGSFTPFYCQNVKTSPPSSKADAKVGLLRTSAKYIQAFLRVYVNFFITS